MQELDDDLLQRYPGSSVHGVQAEDFVNEKNIFIIARLGEQPVGCGALRQLDEHSGEIKRMFVKLSFRGLGIAKQILRELEVQARGFGFRHVRLETGTKQPEAIALYKGMGYYPIPAFGEYVSDPFSVCFEKSLGENAKS